MTADPGEVVATLSVEQRWVLRSLVTGPRDVGGSAAIRRGTADALARRGLVEKRYSRIALTELGIAVARAIEERRET